MQETVNWVSIFAGIAGVASFLLQLGERFAKYRAALQSAFLFCMGLAIGLFVNVAVRAQIAVPGVDARKVFIYAMVAGVAVFNAALILIAVFTKDRGRRDVAYRWAQGVGFFLALFITFKV